MNPIVEALREVRDTLYDKAANHTAAAQAMVDAGQPKVEIAREIGVAEGFFLAQQQITEYMYAVTMDLMRETIMNEKSMSRLEKHIADRLAGD